MHYSSYSNWIRLFSYRIHLFCAPLISVIYTSADIMRRGLFAVFFIILQAVAFERFGGRSGQPAYRHSTRPSTQYSSLHLSQSSAQPGRQSDRYALILRAGSDKWYKDGLSFSCTMCGNCCSGTTGSVRFTAEEKIGMMEKVGIANEADFDEKYCRWVSVLGVSLGGACSMGLGCIGLWMIDYEALVLLYHPSYSQHQTITITH